MKKVEQTEGATSLMKYKEEFETVCSIIATHRKRVIRVVNNESMSMVWEVGGYVSHKLKTSVWGDGVVRQLSDYIRTKYPAARGWSYRTLYKMVQLYDTYTTASFSALIEKTDMTKYGDIVPFETAQIDGKLIVPFEMAQIPNVLFATGWTMKEMKYVNMFNQGVRRVQDMLLENGNKEAVFDVSKLTAFEVTVPSTVDVPQDVPQDVTQGGTQGGTQGDTQSDTQGMYLIYGLKNRLEEILKIERQ